MAKQSFRGRRHRKVGLSDVTLDTDTFQFRSEVLDWRHVVVLSDAVKSGNELTAIDLWQEPETGKFVLVDGHHRLAAYKDAGWEKSIPAIVHECSRKDARLLALADNTKDRLSFSRAEKQDAAWRLVCDEDSNYSKRETCEATGISDGQVGNMRRTRKSLLEANEELPLSWSEALAVQKERVHATMTDEQFKAMRSARIDELDSKFGKALGDACSRYRDAALEVVTFRGGRQFIMELIEHNQDLAYEVLGIEAPLDDRLF